MYEKASGEEAVELVTVTVCACGGVLTDCALKLSDPGETSSNGLVLTNRLTGMFVFGIDAPGALIWMLPEQVVVNAGKPVVLMETLICTGVVPVVCVVCVGNTTIQLLPQVDVDGNAEKLTWVPAGLVTAMFWVCGASVPVCQAKLSCVGVNVSVGAPVVVTVTGILRTVELP